jgi:cyclopropane fatty-acyl-phospholipid synthase-like methyltransferase
MPDAASMYQDGSYVNQAGGLWHLEDANFKATEVLRMIAKHKLSLSTVCDIGCGAGGVLREMYQALPPSVQFTGYDVSPQAHEISKEFVNERCRFLLDDPFTDAQVYDLALALDVFEHVEDCFAFLRNIKKKAKYKMYHVPLEVHASAAVRGVHAWPIGHLHQFSQQTALMTIEHTEQKVLDWRLTGPAFTDSIDLKTRLTHMVRKPLAAVVGKRLTARLLGGYSLLVLAT